MKGYLTRYEQIEKNFFIKTNIPSRAGRIILESKEFYDIRAFVNTG